MSTIRTPVPRNQPHHYRFYTHYCPICASSRTIKERYPGHKPITGDATQDYWATHEEVDYYDYCLG